MEKQKLLMKVIDDDVNPCLEEAAISQKCLEDNFYLRENCTLYYDNYNQCKKFWARIRMERRQAGIKPYLPKREERDKIVELKQKGIHVHSVS